MKYMANVGNRGGQNSSEPIDLGIDEDRLLGALAYIGIFVFVSLLLRRNSSFVTWHVKQGLVLFVGLVIALISAAWISAVGSVLLLIVLLLSVIGLVQALLGRRWRMPIVGVLAEKFRI